MSEAQHTQHQLHAEQHLVALRSLERALQNIETISSKNAFKLLRRLNRLIRKLDSDTNEEERSDILAVAGGGLFAGASFKAPRGKDIPDLFAYAHQKFAKLTHVRRKALLAFITIVYLHPFVDGNGRTARTAFRLLEKPSDLGTSAPSRKQFEAEDVVYPRHIRAAAFAEVLHDRFPDTESVRIVISEKLRDELRAAQDRAMQHISVSLRDTDVQQTRVD
ncbi:MAG: Fic/DOC family, partial [Candidatus Parcubacteria bacterium]